MTAHHPRDLTGLWLALALVGAVLPLAAFVPWLLDHGLDVRRFIAELFATRIGAFFGWDVIVSAIVLFVFVAVEAPRLGLRGTWLPVAATLLIGVSCGLPLFLAMRERAVQARGHGPD